MPRLLAQTKPPLGQSFVLNRDSIQALGLVGWWPTIGPGAGGSLVQGLAGSQRRAPLSNGLSFANNGTLGRVLAFNGTTHVAIVPFGAVPTFQETTPFSVAFWFASTDANGPLVSTFYTSVNAGWKIDINAGSIRGLLQDAASTVGRIVRTTSTSLAGGALTHVVATYSGNSAASGWKIYINGVSVALTTVLDTAPGTLGDVGLILGFDNAQLYAGILADVRVYNRVVTAPEAWQIYAPQTRWELYRPSKWRTIARALARRRTRTLMGVGA